VAVELRPPEGCEFDLVSLGEVMVRLTPPQHQRLEFAANLEVDVGGGEYNVAYALARLGLRTGWVGGLVDNPLGRLVVNHARAQGVDVSAAVTVPFDGVGRQSRMGLHFAEVGAGPRGSLSLYDRGHSATSQLRPGDVDWDDLFDRRGVRWFHTGGIFTCLSDSAAEVAAEALAAARRAGTVVSYDLNFRSKLWSSDQAIATTTPLIDQVDCLIGNEEDFQKVLGFDVPGSDGLDDLAVGAYQQMVTEVAERYPGLSMVGTTLREVVDAGTNNWSAILYWADDRTFHHGPSFEPLTIEDRVGGGDGFCSGLVYALLAGHGPAEAVRIGTVHGALLQTTRGDTSQITLAELEHVVAGGGARINR
jgi:2-dehydro-3-deoxygluconokinase